QERPAAAPGEVRSGVSVRCGAGTHACRVETRLDTCSGLRRCVETERRQECRRGRQECLRHVIVSYLAKLSRKPVETSRSLRWRPCTGLLRKRSLAVTCHPSHFLRTVLAPRSKLRR